MTHRYRHKDWVALKKRLPFSIREDVGAMPAPPGYVLLSFASVAARDYIENALGPSIEPNTTLDLVQYKHARRSEDTNHDFPNP